MPGVKQKAGVLNASNADTRRLKAIVREERAAQCDNDSEIENVNSVHRQLLPRKAGKRYAERPPKPATKGLRDKPKKDKTTAATNTESPREAAPVTRAIDIPVVLNGGSDSLLRNSTVPTSVNGSKRASKRKQMVPTGAKTTPDVKSGDTPIAATMNGAHPDEDATKRARNRRSRKKLRSSTDEPASNTTSVANGSVSPDIVSNDGNGVVGPNNTNGHHSEQPSNSDSGDAADKADASPTKSERDSPLPQSPPMKNSRTRTPTHNPFKLISCDKYGDENAVSKASCFLHSTLIASCLI